MRDQHQDGTGENINQAGQPFGRDGVFLSQGLGDGRCDDDGDGVVQSGAGDGKANQGNEVFTGLPAVDACGQSVDKPGDAAVVADQFDQAGHEHGKDSQEEHIFHAGADGHRPLEERNTAEKDSDDSGHGDSHQEDQHHIHAGNGCYQHSEIRQDFGQAVFQAALDAGSICTAAQEPVDDDRQDGSRQGDGEVHAEFVLHIGTDAFGGADGRIRDDGQVVAEIGSGNRGRTGHAHVESRALGDGNGDRDHGYLGAHGSPDAGRNEGCHQEDARDDEITGQQGKAHIDHGGFAADHISGRCKTACHQDNQPQEHDAGGTGALAVDIDLAGNRDFPAITEQGHCDGGQDGYISGHIGEGFGSSDGGEVNPGPHVQDQEEDHGEKGCRAIIFWFQQIIRHFQHSF